jgi:DNA repair protein RadC
MQIKSENTLVYNAISDDQQIIEQALTILFSRLREPGQALSNPKDTMDYLTLQLADKEQEVFCCLFLDNRHRVIEFKDMFYGTINGASVHPREVVKQALKINAAAVIFAHNHPSGVAEPSEADKVLTRKLSEALSIVDIRALDHIVIGGNDNVSFAERGLI